MLERGNLSHLLEREGYKEAQRLLEGGGTLALTLAFGGGGLSPSSHGLSFCGPHALMHALYALLLGSFHWIGM